MKRSSIPNALCLLRIALIVPVLAAWLALREPYGVIAPLFFIAAITDWLDGYLARKWKLQSPLGAMLDQIADKLLVACLLVILVADQRVGVLVATLLLLREIWVSGVREYLGNQNIAVPVAASGKMKTGLQLVGLSCVLASSAWGNAMWRDTLHISGIACLWSAVAFGAWSARLYTKALFPKY